MNSNCHPKSGRHAIVKAIESHGVQVDSYGGCGSLGRVQDKLGTFHKYRFCVAMENSIRLDYVTEKIWHALEAGCVPIYYGSSNIKEIIPDPNAILLYDDYEKDPVKLAEAIQKLMQDDDAYAKKM